MDNVLLISLLLMVMLLIMAVRYFQAACQLSVAEQWLIDFTDLRDWRKNRALTYRLLRAVAGYEKVNAVALLKVLRRRFGMLLMALSMNVVWIMGLSLTVYRG